MIKVGNKERQKSTKSITKARIVTRSHLQSVILIVTRSNLWSVILIVTRSHLESANLHATWSHLERHPDRYVGRVILIVTWSHLEILGDSGSRLERHKLQGASRRFQGCSGMLLGISSPRSLRGLTCGASS